MARILIAEDEKDIRDLITYLLQFAGHVVIPTVNGEEAFERSKTEVPDLILLDVRMPKLNGYDACLKIKAEESIKHIPVVFLSAKGQESEVAAGLDAGAVEYLLKPFSPDQLSNKVNSILARHGIQVD